MMLGPVLVTPAPASTAKLWVVPRFTGASAALGDTGGDQRRHAQDDAQDEKGPSSGPGSVFHGGAFRLSGIPTRDEACSVRRFTIRTIDWPCRVRYGGIVTGRRYPGRVPPFQVVSDFQPAGDQPKAIEALAAGVDRGDRFQTLLGITGSGKSATIAWTIEKVQRPTLVIAPNKSLAAQLANEFREFFPEQPGRVLRLLLRLLPARGLHALERHLHREGLDRSTTRSTASATRPPRPCWPGGT